MNVFDPKAGGAMVVAALPEGRPLWVDQIRNNFLHPTGESMAAYANAILGEDDGDDIDVDSDPTRGEVIIRSSEGSDESHQDLICRSARAGPQRGIVHEPVADDIETPAENPQGDAAEQLETRKKRKRDKTEEKKVEEPVTETPRKRPSNSSLMDYVVVSDTLSGLDAGDKRSERDPDDDATLTEITKRKKALEDKKKELDAQAAAAQAEKKSKLKKDTAAAPSESEIDLGVFRAQAGNLLEKMSKPATGSRGPPSLLRVHARFIFPRLLPLLLLCPEPLTYLLPALTRTEKGRRMMSRLNKLEKMLLLVLVGVRLMLRMLKLRWSQVKPPLMPLFTPNVCMVPEEVVHPGLAGARNFNMFKIVREWQLMGEDTLEFEAAKKELADEREKFNVEKKGLLWRVSDAEDKLAKEKQFNANKQKEWETACERTNREMQTARDQIVKLKGEKTQISNEAEQERGLYQKRENEYIQRIAKLEKIASEKISERIVKSDELAKYMFELGQAAYNSGRKDGYAEGRAASASNEKDYHFKLYKEDCTVAYAAKRREYEFIEFGIVKAVGKLSRKANVIEVLKKALVDQDPEGGDAGPSHQD
ncbi:hypothetical protein HanIR_Chr16g0809131 [Helianthus annuus]|nr:hypothetical protein HanIR_Chr16g0809131 [Helianthus annuus]